MLVTTLFSLKSEVATLARCCAVPAGQLLLDTLSSIRSVQRFWTASTYNKIHALFRDVDGICVH
jgi:hypothetical protein